ncbi:MAG: hypothetical protein PHH11_16900 [Methylomonas sp.]|nr:hypothetical protein [Methylomonas sp.]
MIIFIRKIPANTKLSEIINFVEPAVKGGLFRRSGSISDAKILALRDVRLRTMEFHGLVTIEPESVAFRVIRKLKGKRFKGKFVIIRQYFQRDWHNDPRQHSEGKIALHIIERRKADRRRGKDLEIMQDISDQFSSAGDFVRRGL